jgi:hypothetical protein
MTSEVKIFGHTLPRGVPAPIEDDEQVTAFNWLRENHLALWSIALHPKNEGRRTGRQAAADKLRGALNTGAADIIIPASPSFVCELKSRRAGAKPTPEQWAYLQSAAALGSFACVAYGHKSFEQAIELYVFELALMERKL